MKVNQCIKTGANVLLTGENVVVHGDLYFISNPGDGVSLVLNYVTPHKSVHLADDEPWPEEYDAVFDTAKIDQYGTQGFLDIPCPGHLGVMVCHHWAAHVSKRIGLPQGYGPIRDGAQEFDIEDAIRAIADKMAEQLGASAGAVSIVRIGRDGSVEEVGDDEPRGTLQ